MHILKIMQIARPTNPTRWHTDARIQVVSSEWPTPYSNLSVILEFYLPPWLGPLLWSMHEQWLVHLFDGNPIVLAVQIWKSMQNNDNRNKTQKPTLTKHYVADFNFYNLKNSHIYNVGKTLSTPSCLVLMLS